MGGGGLSSGLGLGGRVSHCWFLGLGFGLWVMGYIILLLVVKDLNSYVTVGLGSLALENRGVGL